MRLISAIYDDFWPFDRTGLFNSFISTIDPDTLMAGDVLIVWGGQDISPSLYNKQTSAKTGADPFPSRRDRIEWGLMQRAKELGLPIIGICRGAQMLCALAGGYLMQHVTGHGGYHSVITPSGESFVTNSLHHQMMVPGNTAHEILAQIPPDSLRSKEYWDENTTVDHNQEPEFIYFNEVKGFAVQWHPEMLSKIDDGTNYIFKQLKERI